MNVAIRFAILLFLLTVQADGFTFQQHTPRPSSDERNLHREDHGTPSTADFLADPATMTSESDSAEDFSDIAAALDALTAASTDSPFSTAASTDPPFSSSWSSALDRSDDPAGEKGTGSSEGDEFEGVGANFTLSPGLNDALTALDQAVGSTFSSSIASDLDGTIGGDINMADGEIIPSGTTATHAPYAVVTLFIVAHVFILEMAD